MTEAVNQSNRERVAALKEMEASVTIFEAALIRGEAHAIGKATESAHLVFQAYLDSIAAFWGTVKRDAT